MRLLLGWFLTFLVAAVAGLGATWLALSQEVTFGAVTIGAWTAHPRTGTTDIDPYARALIARTGRLPVGSGDGVAFLARTDDEGRKLDGRCEVHISGITPPARFWTLTLYDPEGRLVSNLANRFGFTSQEIVRRADGSFEIIVSPRVHPGNWLPTAGTERYVLALRLYDTPVGASTRPGREAPMPAITRGECQ